jgi:hypothetical protein
MPLSGALIQVALPGFAWAGGLAVVTNLATGVPPLQGGDEQSEDWCADEGAEHGLVPEPDPTDERKDGSDHWGKEHLAERTLRASHSQILTPA